MVVRKPTIRLLMDIHYRTDPAKMMNLRIDTLAQILTQANVRSGTKCMVFETGCQGMVVAAALERVGPHPDGKVVHLFQVDKRSSIHLHSQF